MEMLTGKQFSEKYPIGDTETSENAWLKMLMRWRDEGKLLENRHYRLVRLDGCIPRAYNNVRVIKLIWIEAGGKAPRPRIKYLCEQYGVEFRAILEEAIAVDRAGTAGKEQANVS